MAFARVRRTARSNKSKVVLLRLTESEHADFDRLKNRLQFRSMRELILFSLDIVDELHKWDCKDYRFYIGYPEKQVYKEIEFELKPFDKSERW